VLARTYTRQTLNDDDDDDDDDDDVAASLILDVAASLLS
jgi:hypothetical protein